MYFFTQLCPSLSAFNLSLSNGKSFCYLTCFAKADYNCRIIQKGPPNYSVVCLIFNFSFCNHMKDLLSITLSPNKAFENTAAVNVFAIGDPDISRSCINAGFSDIASQLLVDPSTPDGVIGKIVCIATSILCSFPQESSEHLSFIYSLLSHISNPSVSSFFKFVFCSSGEMCVFHEWLAQMGFPEMINRKLSGSTDDNLSFQLFDLIGESAQCESLYRQYLVPETLLNFMKPPTDPSTAIFYENSRWKAINVICRKDSAEILKPLVGEALKILCVSRVESLHLYHSCAIDFLSKMISFQEEIFDIIMVNDSYIYPFQIVLQYPDNTFLFHSFQKFFDILSTNSKAVRQMATICFPLCLEELALHTNKAAFMLFFHLYEKFRSIADNDKELAKVLDNLFDTRPEALLEIRRVQNVLDESYGGKMNGKLTSFFKRII